MISAIIALNVGGFIAYLILSRYKPGRNKRFRIILWSCFFGFFLLCGIISGYLHIADKWYITGSAPVLCAYLAAFTALLIAPYSISEALAQHVPKDYLSTLPYNEMMLTSLRKYPNVQVKGLAMSALYKLLYCHHSSPQQAMATMRELLKTAISLYDSGHITTNGIFISLITVQIEQFIKNSPQADRLKPLIINLIYEIILSGHNNGEIANRQESPTIEETANRNPRNQIPS